jgi:hypothetical protein
MWMSVQKFAAASHKFTEPTVTGVEPADTESVNVATVLEEQKLLVHHSL